MSRYLNCSCAVHVESHSVADSVTIMLHRMPTKVSPLAVLLCASLALASTMPAQAAGTAKAVVPAELDHLIITKLTSEGATKPEIIAHIDLTSPFKTLTPWTFVIARDNAPPPNADDLEHGALSLCFAKGLVPDCSEKLFPQDDTEYSWFHTPYDLRDTRVVYAGDKGTSPLLLIQLCGAYSGNGDCGIATALYDYDRRADRFRRVFLNFTAKNRNQATRFVESGPLRGNVIVDYPTDNAPYTYWIEVHRPAASGLYTRVLRYRGHTGYGDGNRLAVADSEMPEILRRVGLWRPGDALPVPPSLSKECPHPIMRRLEEWCQ